VKDRPARYIVAIGSGKGGVGKSTVSLHLALALARRGLAVGLLDADVYGPDIPLMVNLTRHEDARRWDFWRQGDVRHEPLESHGIRIMSVGFLLGERQALTLGAPLLTAALRQLVHQVEWGRLDILMLDLPPGRRIFSSNSSASSRSTVRSSLSAPRTSPISMPGSSSPFFATTDVPVLGAVENMSGLHCPHCGELIEVFTPVTKSRSVWAEGVPLLGRIPLDPALGTLEGPTRPQSEAFDAVAAQMFDALERRTAA